MSAAGAEREPVREAALRCPICGGDAIVSAPAFISPFLRERCRLASNVEGESHLCEACDHVFFTPLLTDRELERLYTGYRSDHYNAERTRLEPDYQGYISEFADLDSAHHQVRRAFYDEFHAERFGLHGLVVDAGEGEGYFGRYAYPCADVVTLGRVGETPGVVVPELMAQADVLFLAHALQQSPRPVQALARLTRWMRPQTEVWLEVPVQYTGSLPASFRTMLALAARGAKPSGPLATLHENLSHYSVRSLRRLCERTGLVAGEVVRSGIGVLGVLARRSADRLDVPPSSTLPADLPGSEPLREPHD